MHKRGISPSPAPSSPSGGGDACSGVLASAQSRRHFSSRHMAPTAFSCDRPCGERVLSWGFARYQTSVRMCACVRVCVRVISSQFRFIFASSPSSLSSCLIGTPHLVGVFTLLPLHTSTPPPSPTRYSDSFRLLRPTATVLVLKTLHPFCFSLPASVVLHSRVVVVGGALFFLISRRLSWRDRFIFFSNRPHAVWFRFLGFFSGFLR